jgi:short-subunit dehydrogenase
MASTCKPVTLITGASAGIGAELARVFARQGFELALVARREDRLSALADALEDEGPGRPEVFAIDLQAGNGTEELAQALAQRALRPEIVVNSAGFGLLGAATRLDRERQLAMVDLNVRVLTDLSLRFIDGMTTPQTGIIKGIINMGSLAGFLPGPGMAVYHACKAYVLSFSLALHRELKPRGITVTVACPGPVRTQFQEVSGIATDRLPRRLVRSAERVARDTYAGFIAGRRQVIPGFANKVVATLPHFLSRGRILDMVEAHQRALAAPDRDAG